MRKMLLLLMLCGMLAGCGAQPVFEPLGEIPVEGTLAQPQEILVELPGDLLQPVLQSDDLGKLYISDDFTMTLQTLEGGDLDGTLRTCTGFGKEDLTVISTQLGEVSRYDTAWTAVGEGEPQIGRLAILDDGSYHYVLSVMAPSQKSGDLQEKWQYLFDTFRLESMNVPFRIGS